MSENNQPEWMEQGAEVTWRDSYDRNMTGAKVIKETNKPGVYIDRYGGRFHSHYEANQRAAIIGGLTLFIGFLLGVLVPL